MNDKSAVEKIRDILGDPFVDNPDLTEQDREAARLASRGFTYTEIARAMGEKENTVNYWFRRITEKTGISKSRIPWYTLKQIEAVINRNGG